LPAALKSLFQGRLKLRSGVLYQCKERFTGEARLVVLFDMVRVGLEEIEQLDIDFPLFLPVTGVGIENEGIPRHHALVSDEGTRRAGDGGAGRDPGQS
jgi:hypothetical protein